MKILAGTHRGHPIIRPKTRSVRPMGDKVRAALFDIVGPVRIGGAKVLDAYAGSGAVGLEALSRGADFVVAVEQNAQVASVINQNAEKLDLRSNYQLVVNNVSIFLKSRGEGHPSTVFGLIVADPPYGEIDAQILSELGEMVEPKGLMVVSHSSRIAAPTLQSVELVQTRIYGDAALSFYRLKAGEF